MLPFRDGVDLVYAERAGTGQGPLTAVSRDRSANGAGSSVRQPAAGLYTNLQHALDTYRVRWGHLPRVEIPAGSIMRPGQSGARVALLRERLGLSRQGTFDGELAAVLSAYRGVHGLGPGALADAATVTSLNRGSGYYERLIQLNLERLRAIPAEASSRYILVDAAAARLWLYEDGQPVDSMKVVVGSVAHPTPMLKTMIYSAEVNPYWNVPPDLVQKLIAPRVVKQGLRYLKAQHYELLSDWSNEATPVDPATVDWHAIADGRSNVRVRQRPSPTNAMGKVKFTTRNDYGIYLHDTPNKELFLRSDRWQSNGCVRVEDAPRLARWLFGGMPGALRSNPGEIVPLDRPIPVYITYLTATVAQTGDVTFQNDTYRRDDTALAGLPETKTSFASAY